MAPNLSLHFTWLFTENIRSFDYQKAKVARLEASIFHRRQEERRRHCDNRFTAEPFTCLFHRFFRTNYMALPMCASVKSCFSALSVFSCSAKIKARSRPRSF